MAAIFTQDALYSCSLYGEPPTGKNSVQRPGLNSDAVDLIIGNFDIFIVKTLLFL